MIIDTVYENVIEKLTKEGKILQMSKEFASKTNFSDKVLFVYKLIEKDIPLVLSVNKSEHVSTYYRNHGNKYFKKNQDYTALQYYNLSLLHSPKNTHNFLLAISNRSAVLFSMKKFNECLEDIEKVFALGCPQELKEKLVKRKKDCLKNKLMQVNLNENNNNLDDILKMKSEKCKSYTCASSKLQVMYNKDMGRHVIAKEKLNVGDVLVVEDPYVTLLLKPQILFSCSYCLSRNLNLQPCEGCCFALYCSSECREKAYKDYHRVECHLMPTLLDMQFTKLELLALRFVIKSRYDYNNWNELFEVVEDAESKINTELQGKIIVDGEYIYDSKYYPSIHTLSSNSEKRSVSDLFQKSVTAAVLLHFLKEIHFMEHESQAEKILHFVAGNLLNHLLIVPTNMHGLSTNIANKYGDYVEDLNIGSAGYAYLSLLNHSCAPNVVRANKLGSGQTTLIALRPIKKGMQLFDSYGQHHALEESHSRQSDLLFQYKFKCICEACVNNWPTYMSISKKNLPNELVKKKEQILSKLVIGKLKKGNLELAVSLFPKICNLLELLEKYSPCVEVMDCQEALKQCFFIMQGVLPYGFNTQVEWNAAPYKKA